MERSYKNENTVYSYNKDRDAFRVTPKKAPEGSASQLSPTGNSMSAGSIPNIPMNTVTNMPGNSISSGGWVVRDKPEEKTAERNSSENSAVMNRPASRRKAASETELTVSQDRLQEAIIWSEVLGKPLSRRRKRRDLWQ